MPTPVFVQSAAYGHSAASATTVPKAFTSANTAGNCIIAVVEADFTSANTSHITGVNDSNSNVYNLVCTSRSTDNLNCYAIYVAYNIAAGTNTVTAAITGLTTSAGYSSITISEYTNVTGVSGYNLTVSSSNGTAEATGNITATAGQLLFTYVKSSGGTSQTVGGTFTKRQSTVNGWNLATADRIAVAGSISSSWTSNTTGVWWVAIVSFIPVGTPAPGTFSVLDSGSSHLNFEAKGTGTFGVLDAATGRLPNVPAYIQAASWDSLNNTYISISKQFPANQTAGNTNVVLVYGTGNAVTPTMSDTDGNTYTLSESALNYYNNNFWVFVCSGILGGTSLNTVTAVFSANHTYSAIIIAEYSGVGSLDVQSLYTQTPGAYGPALTSVTTTNAYDLLVSFVLVNGSRFQTITSPGWISRVNTAQANFVLMDQNTSSVGTYVSSCSITGGSIWAAAIVAFKANVAPPVLSIQPPIVYITSAVLNGIMVANGAPVTVEGFHWGTATSYGNTVSASGTFTTGAFTQTITGLTAGTTYFYQAFGTNSAGTGVSVGGSFTTPSTVTAPFVSANAPSSISTTTLILNGSVTANNGGTVSVVGFNYGLTSSYGSTVSSSGTFGIGPFLQYVTGLLSNTTYHYQAFATNSGGTTTSSDQTFTTASVPSFASGEVIYNGPQIGTPGSYQSNGNVIANLFDANGLTWWDSAHASGDWAGIDAGAITQLTRVRITPKGCYEDCVIGGQIQASNDPLFINGVSTLYTITARPITGTLLTEYAMPSQGSSYYRYFRYAPASGYTSLADIEFVGKYYSGLTAQSAPVTFSTPGGIYDFSIVLLLSCITPGAAIYYTTDGTIPTTASALYSGNLIVSSNYTVNVISVLAGLSNSRVTSQTYAVDGSIISTNTLTDNRGYRVWATNPNFLWDPVSNQWYMYGDNWDCGNIDMLFIGINVYSSPDFRNWTYQGLILAPGAGNANGIANTALVDRVHILYNALNNNYVLWGRQYNNGAVVYVNFTSTSPTGPFTNRTVVGSIDGYITGGDLKAWLDPSTGYAWLFWCTANNSNDGVTRLNSSFTASDGVNHVYWVEGSGSTTPFGQPSEGHGIVLINGVYIWMCSNATSGWGSSLNLYITATNPLGPWSSPGVNPFVNVVVPTTSQEAIISTRNCIPATTNAYDSQVVGLINIPGRSANNVIWIADRYDFENIAGAFQTAAGSFYNYRTIIQPATVTTSGSGSGATATMSITWNNAWSFDGTYPTVSGAPAAASGLIVNQATGSAAWTNNETHPANIYLDSSPTSAFTSNVVSQVLTPGTTAVSLVQYNQKYRIRTVNANGSTSSSIVSPSNPAGGVFSIIDSSASHALYEGKGAGTLGALDAAFARLAMEGHSGDSLSVSYSAFARLLAEGKGAGLFSAIDSGLSHPLFDGKGLGTFNALDVGAAHQMQESTGLAALRISDSALARFLAEGKALSLFSAIDSGAAHQILRSTSLATVSVTDAVFARLLAEGKGSGLFTAAESGLARLLIEGKSSGSFIITDFGVPRQLQRGTSLATVNVADSALARLLIKGKAFSSFGLSSGAFARLLAEGNGSSFFGALDFGTAHQLQRSASLSTVNVSDAAFARLQARGKSAGLFSVFWEIGENKGPGTLLITNAAFARLLAEGNTFGSFHVADAAFARVLAEGKSLGSFSGLASNPILSRLHANLKSSGFFVMLDTAIAHPVQRSVAISYLVVAAAGLVNSRVGYRSSALADIVFLDSALGRQLAGGLRGLAFFTVLNSGMAEQLQEVFASGLLSVSGLAIGHVSALLAPNNITAGQQAYVSVPINGEEIYPASEYQFQLLVSTLGVNSAFSVPVIISNNYTVNSDNSLITFTLQSYETARLFGYLSCHWILMVQAPQSYSSEYSWGWMPVH